MTLLKRIDKYAFDKLEPNSNYNKLVLEIRTLYDRYDQLIYMNFWTIILSYNDWTLVKIELVKKLFKKSSNSK